MWHWAALAWHWAALAWRWAALAWHWAALAWHWAALANGRVGQALGRAGDRTAGLLGQVWNLSEMPLQFLINNSAARVRPQSCHLVLP